MRACRFAKCKRKVVHFIGSLAAEVAGEEKFGYCCDDHYKEIERENVKYAREATARGMTTATYIDELMGKKCKVLGPQSVPNDPRIFNRPGNTRPISKFFER